VNTAKQEEFLSNLDLVIEVKTCLVYKYVRIDIYFVGTGHSKCFCRQFNVSFCCIVL